MKSIRQNAKHINDADHRRKQRILERQIQQRKFTINAIDFYVFFIVRGGSEFTRVTEIMILKYHEYYEIEGTLSVLFNINRIFGSTCDEYL